MLDLALDEGTISMWPGLAGAMTCLLDRGNLQRQRTDWIASHQPPAYDVAGADDETRHHGRSDSYATAAKDAASRPAPARPARARLPRECARPTA